MVTIGYRPILWHVMKFYAHFGYRDFILALGYKADVIKEYFLRYNEALSNDFVLSGKRSRHRVPRPRPRRLADRFVDTGLNANLGQRLLAVKRYLDPRDLPGELRRHADRRPARHAGRLELGVRRDASFLSVKPQSYLFHLVRHGANGLVECIEAVRTADVWINGGYFMFRPEIFDHIRPGDELVEAPFRRLIEQGKLALSPLRRLLALMDTLKDVQNLETQWDAGEPPWAVWARRNRSRPRERPARWRSCPTGHSACSRWGARRRHRDRCRRDDPPAGRRGTRGLEARWLVLSADETRSAEAGAAACAFAGDGVRVTPAVTATLVPGRLRGREGERDRRGRRVRAGPRARPCAPRPSPGPPPRRITWQVLRAHAIWGSASRSAEATQATPTYVRLSSEIARRKVDLLLSCSAAGRPRVVRPRDVHGAAAAARPRSQGARRLCRGVPCLEGGGLTMPVLVTGHLGYIGTVLTPMLLAAGHDVVGLDADLYGTCTFGSPDATPRSPASAATCATWSPPTSPASTRSSTSPRCRTTRWATSTRS